MIKKIINLLFCGSLMALFVGQRVFAQDLSDLQQTPDIDILLPTLMNRIPVYLGGFAFIALVYSGAMYVLALGDTNKMEAAKKNITWTLIGIIAAMSVWAIIKLITDVFSRSLSGMP